MRTASLSVPPMRWSLDGCVPICAATMLATFGVRATAKRLAQEMGTTKTLGTNLYEASLWFLQHEFHVLLCGWENNFPHNFLKLSATDAQPALREWLRSRAAMHHFAKKERKLFESFCDAGGQYMPRPVTPTHVCKAMSLGIPTMLVVNASLLLPIRERFAPHAVVPVKVTANRCTVYDPSFASPNGVMTYPTWQLFFASHYNGGEALFTCPKTMSLRTPIWT